MQTRLLFRFRFHVLYRELTPRGDVSGADCPNNDIWMSTDDERFFPLLFSCAVLVIFSGIMSGLQQGMMTISCDPVRYPLTGRLSTLLGPLCKKRHLTLVTLLVANSLAMEALPVCLDILMPHVAAVVVSVTFVVLFGEIIPQALCMRYPLRLSASFAWLVWLIIIPLLPIAYTIAAILDWLLGKERQNGYNRQGLFEVVRTHDVEHGGPLTADERDIIEGTLELADKTSESILIPNSSVFKVSFDARLDDALMREILDSGRSRVPVYKDNEDNIIGLLLVKQLIRLHTLPNAPNVSDIRLVPAVIVSTSSSLFDLLKTFRSGASHLAVVVRGAGGGTNFRIRPAPVGFYRHRHTRGCA